MNFKIIKKFELFQHSVRNVGYLVHDNWDDFSYKTSYELIYIDEKSTIHKIGTVKIGYFGQNITEQSLKIKDSFEHLDRRYFSLGQSDTYYSNLNELGPLNRDLILISLRDIAKDSELFNSAINENVTKISLLRTVSITSVIGQFRRLSEGGARLTDYNFKFIAPKQKNQSNSTYQLSFHVEPESFPPTNIHVLIGRNGVGKTYLINNMISSLIDDDGRSKAFGEFISQSHHNTLLFANLISISFSAFDESEPRRENKDKTKGIQYSYIGLKQIQDKDKDLSPKSTTVLKNEFYKSLISCKTSSKSERWKKCIGMLESDPNFMESEIKALIEIENEVELKVTAFNIFKRLSSGHKIILLTITRLIESLQERSLVLIDEPEAHLHPPLLSAFIRALSELLVTTNGVAIIATHSPVILQEIPKSCVWKLRRTGNEAVAERSEIETFGENVGILTNEVFGFEVTNSGFYKLISDIVKEKPLYQDVIDHFNNELGMEAKAIIMSLCVNNNIANA